MKRGEFEEEYSKYGTIRDEMLNTLPLGHECSSAGEGQRRGLDVIGHDEC